MPEAPSADHGFGLFGPDFGVPQGGFCLSTFLFLEREGRILAGRMDEAESQTWIDAWAPNVDFYEGKRYEALFEGLRLPATYLRTGEHPDEAVQRVAHDQLGLARGFDPGDPQIVTSAKDSRRALDAKHWDVLFAYRAEGPELREVPDHWANLAYHDTSELSSEDFVMLHGDLLDAI